MALAQMKDKNRTDGESIRIKGVAANYRLVTEKAVQKVPKSGIIMSMQGCTCTLQFAGIGHGHCHANGLYRGIFGSYPDQASA